MLRSLILLVLLVSLPTLAAGPLSSLRQAIAGGQLEGGYPGVGRVATGQFLGAGVCTGTLIAPDVVLTAAHCIGTPQSVRFEITDPSDGRTTLRSFRARVALAHPEYVKEAGSSGLLEARNDLGLLVLEEPVPPELATPLPVRRSPLTGELAMEHILAIGYGQTSNAEDSAGTKHSGTFRISGISESNYVHLPASEPGVQETPEICPGDSGGPDLYREDGVDAIIGVHSMGSRDCGFSESARVDIHLGDFIDPVLAGHVPEGCTGTTLDEAVCHAEIEASGCGCTTSSFSPFATLSLLLVAMRLRRRHLSA